MPLVIVFCSIVLLGLTVLVLYHYFLASTFQTTYEHRKGSYSKFQWRPFDSGSCFKNLAQRVFARKSESAIFDPLEPHDPDTQNFKASALKTP